MWMFVGKTLSEKLKFAADILQAINLILALVAGCIIWHEFELFAGTLSTVFFMFVAWALKLSMYALSQLCAQSDENAERLRQMEKRLPQCAHGANPAEGQLN